MRKARKAETYISSKPCKRGHFERYVSTKQCMICQKLWNDINKESRKAKGIIYRLKNKEAITTYKKKYGEENRDVIRAKKLESHRQNPRSAMLRSARKRAKNTGLEFNIVESDIVIPKYCPVFPELQLETNHGVVKANSPTLDRIDNNKGYITDNIQVISYRANRLKGDATCGELKRLYEYTKSLQEKN